MLRECLVLHRNSGIKCFSNSVAQKKLTPTANQSKEKSYEEPIRTQRKNEANWLKRWKR